MARQLTIKEKEVLKKRETDFESFFLESKDILINFIEMLELQNSTQVISNPSLFLPSVDYYFSQQDIDNEIKNWVISRLGYFIGQILIQHFQGVWQINKTPDTSFFLHYVIGNFHSFTKKNVLIDPFQVALDYINLPKGRSLINHLKKVYTQIEQNV